MSVPWIEPHTACSMNENTTLFLDVGGVLQARPGIIRLVLDIAQTPAERTVYIENTPLFVQSAEELGIRSILHTDYESTRAKLATFGLETDEGVRHATS